MNDKIRIVTFETNAGNTLQVFFNQTTGLLVVDLIDKNEEGGNEIYRHILDEKEMLSHCR